MVIVHGDAGALVELLHIADCNAGAGHERGKQLRQFAKEIEATDREGQRDVWRGRWRGASGAGGREIGPGFLVAV